MSQNDFEKYVYVAPLNALPIKQDGFNPKTLIFEVSARQYKGTDEIISEREAKRRELGEYGYTHRSIPFNKLFFENLVPDDFEESTVGHNGKDILDTKVRSSKTYKEPVGTNMYETEINPREISPIKDSLECKMNYKFKLIQYQAGDHFDQFHYDTFSNQEIVTILVYPPSSVTGQEYKGGDLVFQIDEQEYRIKPSEFKDEFMCVIFGNVLHKCEPVTEGVRYVLKGTISSSLPKVFSEERMIKLEELQELKIDNQGQIDEIDKLLNAKNKEVKEAIDAYYEYVHNDAKFMFPEDLDKREDEDYERKELNRQYQLLLYEYNMLINQKNQASGKNDDLNYKLVEDKHNICVLPVFIEELRNYQKYPIGLIEYIKKLIAQGWKVTPIYDTVDFRTDHEFSGYGETKIQRTHLFYDFDEYSCYRYRAKKGIYNLHYPEKYIRMGKLVSKYSEYNDSSGDDIYEEFQCSCLLITKLCE